MGFSQANSFVVFVLANTAIFMLAILPRMWLVFLSFVFFFISFPFIFLFFCRLKGQEGVGY
jgi:hypothetical protein